MFSLNDLLDGVKLLGIQFSWDNTFTLKSLSQDKAFDSVRNLYGAVNTQWHRDILA